MNDECCSIQFYVIEVLHVKNSFNFSKELFYNHVTVTEEYCNLAEAFINNSHICYLFMFLSGRILCVLSVYTATHYTVKGGIITGNLETRVVQVYTLSGVKYTLVNSDAVLLKRILKNKTGFVLLLKQNKPDLVFHHQS